MRVLRCLAIGVSISFLVDEEAWLRLSGCDSLDLSTDRMSFSSVPPLEATFPASLSPEIRDPKLWHRNGEQEHGHNLVKFFKLKLAVANLDSIRTSFDTPTLSTQVPKEEFRNAPGLLGYPLE